ncbi:pilus assembly protein [Propionivibrio soli]|uniref:pilus assembly protein n=1 Tax=Propionivibrio soli TaxID=2976531 RepID=UPI0021E90A72|nr:PilC/PilY family type IV pilus protein [Propionivibrio soli]
MKQRLLFVSSFGIFAAASCPVFAGVLADAPLSVIAPVPSNVIFPLSVEFPTANTAAYQGTNDYNRTNTYLGIFDDKKCYTYDATNQWFEPAGLATNHSCTAKWSGNFLNWASMTGLDEFRYAMTGGNRYRDTSTLTVLERTYQSGQGGTNNFPDKSYSGSGDTPHTSISKIVNQGQGVSMAVTVGATTTTYRVRAKVCVNDSAVGGLESNCVGYGSGANTVYKPIGAIQRNGDKMRFGVFSYFKDNSIDNAVMRSKAKYVAPTKWTASGSVSNGNKEWSATDGTFFSNPDPDDATNSYNGAVTNSGVINYINKFGTAAGGYKTYDNVGKLYYEALKYLRGLQPTSNFYTGATTANNDNFPVITSWDDPVQYSCQKNFIMVMGDTHTWCDKRLPGGSFTGTNNSQCNATATQVADKGSLSGDTDLNVTTWTNKIGSLESISNMATTGIQNGASYYLSGMAYWAAYNGFRPKSDLTSHTPDTSRDNNVKAKTFIIDVLENKDLGQNKQYWFAAKYGGADSFAATNGAAQDWSTSRTFSSPYPTFSGDWPKTLLPAGDPASMISAVNSAFATIASQSVSSTPSSASVADMATTTASAANIYEVKYDPSKWTGDVESYTLDRTTMEKSASPVWKASNRLPAWNSRKIVTFNDGLNADGTETSATNARQGVLFTSGTFSSNLSPRQQAFLNLNPATGTSDGRGAARVDYLRGDAVNEGSSGYQWRARASRLGDFINSGAVYVKYPKGLVRGTDYGTYATAVTSRTPMLYAGGNDGMLHAFNAEAGSDGNPTTNSGREIFAYVPSAVYSRLGLLAWPDYSHKYYVDATPIVADAKLTGSGCTSGSDAYKCWRTVLVGGLGGGGQGVYALNITDPSSFSSASPSSIAMWEFTDRDDADMGYSFARPYVAQMNNGKWAVIVGNGFNSKDADNDVGGVQRTGSGRANLFILFLDGPTGTNRAWVSGTDYIKIELKSPDESATTPEPNGLASVQGIDNDRDGKVDYLYAGDRRGNLWKIDVSGSATSGWKSAFGSIAEPTPLFTAKTADTTPVLQQVTAPPTVIRHPNGGFMVLFGTGSYIDQGDSTGPFTMQSFYGIWDKNNGTTVSRSQLQKQKTLATASFEGKLYGLQSTCVANYSTSAVTRSSATTTCPSSLQPVGSPISQQRGWVLDLNFSGSSTNPGERYVSDVEAGIADGVLTFVTLTPASSDPCEGGATDLMYDLDYLSGAAPSTPTFLHVVSNMYEPISVSFSVGGNTFRSNPSSVKINQAGTGKNAGSIKLSVEGGGPRISSEILESGGSPCKPLSATTPSNAAFVPGRQCLVTRLNKTLDTIKRDRRPATVTWRQTVQ